MWRPAGPRDSLFRRAWGLPLYVCSDLLCRKGSTVREEQNYRAAARRLLGTENRLLRNLSVGPFCFRHVYLRPKPRNGVLEWSQVWPMQLQLVRG